MDVSERIKSLRLAKNMTQEELGNLVGVKKAAINKYENGSVKNLKRVTIQKLSKALDVNPAYLLGYTDNPILEEKKPAEYSELDLENIELFRKLSKQQQKQVLDFMRFLNGN